MHDNKHYNYHICKFKSSPSMQNGTSGELQCASWDFDLKRMHLVHADYKLHTSPS